MSRVELRGATGHPPSFTAAKALVESDAEAIELIPFGSGLVRGTPLSEWTEFPVLAEVLHEDRIVFAEVNRCTGRNDTTSGFSLALT